MLVIYSSEVTYLSNKPVLSRRSTMAALEQAIGMDGYEIKLRDGREDLGYERDAKAINHAHELAIHALSEKIDGRLKVADSQVSFSHSIACQERPMGGGRVYRLWIVSVQAHVLGSQKSVNDPMRNGS
jgi:hypothetical protein